MGPSKCGLDKQERIVIPIRLPDRRLLGGLAEGREESLFSIGKPPLRSHLPAVDEHRLPMRESQCPRAHRLAFLKNKLHIDGEVNIFANQQPASLERFVPD